MKTPDPKKSESSATRTGAPIIAHGELPGKPDTVTAEVLARLLNHERLTCLDAVNEASTTRLSAVTFSLRKAYGWPIEKIDKAVGCRDGRVALVSEYFLAAEVVAHAMAAGAGLWCSKVRAARLKRRANAAQAKRQASRANAARKAYREQKNQQGLFEGGAYHG